MRAYLSVILSRLLCTNDYGTFKSQQHTISLRKDEYELMVVSRLCEMKYAEPYILSYLRLRSCQQHPGPH